MAPADSGGTGGGGGVIGVEGGALRPEHVNYVLCLLVFPYTAEVFVPTDRPEVLTAILVKWPAQAILPKAA